MTNKACKKLHYIVADVGNPLMCIYPHTIMLVCMVPFQLAANNHFFQLHYVGMSEPQQQGDLSEAADWDP